MRTDARTQEFIKHWGKADMPTARVSHGTVPPGDYPAFALLGWVEQRKVGWPVVGLRMTLLNLEMNRSVGGLTMGIPLTPKSERHVCCLLQDLGWDGRVWPYKDHGWPEGAAEEMDLLGLLRAAKLGATMTFLSDPEKGTPTVRMPVLKRSGSFMVAPFGDEILPRHLEALRSLAADPTPFKSDWDIKQ
jgi:hypothetical protein